MSLLPGTEAYGFSVHDGVLRGGFMSGLRLGPEFHSAEAKLEDLAAQGLDGAIISPVPSLFAYTLKGPLGETLTRTANEGLAAISADSGGRIAWMATVPMQDQARAQAVLAEAAEAGCVGVHIGTTVAGRPLDAPEFEPFWSASAERDLVVMIHPAAGVPNPALEGYHLRNVVGHLAETTAAAERLIISGVLDRHPDIRVVLAHGGGFFPYQAGRLRHARTVRPELAGAPEDPWSYAGQLVFDTITHDVQALRYLVHRVGADNVVIGTDLPHDMAARNAVEMVTEAVGDELAAQIAEANPQRLFRLPSNVS